MIDRVSDKALKKFTGKIWEEWIKILTKAGAKNWSHQEIVAYLKTKQKQTSWWRQVVANGFQVATGKRIAGQSLKGTYTCTLTKSVKLDHKKIWNWCVSPEGIEVWLKPMSPITITKGESFEIEGGVYGEIRTLKKFQRVRMSWREIDWEKGTTVQLHMHKRAKDKSMLSISHDGLRTARKKAEMRDYWRKVIDEMAARLSV
jgi:activator of HSP90 ATPase